MKRNGRGYAVGNFFNDYFKYFFLYLDLK